MADSIANQFTGLPIENLIAAPLLAAAEGQKTLAATTASFIQEVGMDKDGNTKSVAFKYEDGSECCFRCAFIIYYKYTKFMCR